MNTDEWCELVNKRMMDYAGIVRVRPQADLENNV